MVASFANKMTLLFGLLIMASIPAAAQTKPLPEIPDLAGKVLTVKGPIAPSELGQTLIHEHIFVDFKLPLPERPDPATDVELSRQPLTISNLQAVRSGHWNADNDFLGNFEDSLNEVRDFKAIGGGTIVDVSNIRLGRDPIALFKISNASGLHVVMGASWYQKRYHPLNMSEMKLEELTNIMVRDIAVGVDGTDIRSGVIGEVGVNGNPLTDNELKVIRASARASRLTGAPISFHVGGVGEEKFRVLDLVASEGVAMSSVIMGHSNSLSVDLPFARRVLARGVYIEFDWLGAPGSPGGYLDSRHDRKVAEGIAKLVKEGFAGQIVLSHDVCTKLQLKKYGGLGFTYINDYFLPVLREMGVSEADIHKMMVENPARALGFVEPRPLVVAAAISMPTIAQQQPMAHWDEARLSQPQYKVLMEHNVQVKMRDGIYLSTDIYLPDVPDKFPTILSRTPYSNNGAGNVEQGKWFAERGYAFVTQDVRGKYDSGGKYTLFRDEANDGYDTIEWIGAQPWSNGKVGMTGGSYGGYVQIAPGVLNSKYLTALAASVTTSDIFNNWIYVDGTLFLSFALGWGAVDMDGHVMQYGPAYDWPAVYRHLPLATIDRAASHTNLGFREWLKHPRANDPFWKGVSFENEVSKISVPFLVVEGWYDIFLRGALQDDITIRKDSKSELARKNKRLMIGPWSHNTGIRNNNPGLPKTGPDRSIDFGPNAEVMLRNVYLRWHDYWLKGIRNGVETEPPIKIFVMGENYWRYENEWPLARTQYTKYYIGGAGKANGASGDGTLSAMPPSGGAATDSFTYDPASPVPTLGGNLLDCLGCNSVSWGPVNQVKAETRDDVLIYTTPVLTEAVEVTGPITMKLFAATNAKDTDWTAKLVDVHPDGYAQNIQDGIIRARYRKGKEAPASLLEPGKIYEYDIDLWATSNTFLPGHRIRVEVSSSNFPRFERNLNTGEDPMTGTRMEKAQQTIYHSAQYPSHIVLPVIPRAPVAK